MIEKRRGKESQGDEEGVLLPYSGHKFETLDLTANIRNSVSRPIILNFQSVRALINYTLKIKP